MIDDAHTRRVKRRAAARSTIRRRRLLAGGGAGTLLVLLLVAIASSNSDRLVPPRVSQTASKSGALPRIIDGGPLAPASAGGLAALWAPANVVAPQPGTAAAYAAASRRSGLPGYLLIADRGNNRVLVIDPAGRVAFRYPTAADLAAGRKLNYNDDTFVEPGGAALIANEEDNHAIVEIGLADHSLHVLFGVPGHVGAGATHLNTPDDAYSLANGTITVADAYNCRILFIGWGMIQHQLGRAGDCRHAPPTAFGPVNGDTPMPDGGVMVSEIPGNWVDAIGPDGRLEFAVRAPVGYPSDPQPLPGGRILLADYSNPGHVVIMDRHGHTLWRFGSASGPNHMDHPSLAMALPNGDIAVNDDYRQRVIVINPRTNRVVWSYGHADMSGTAPGYLNTPDGMDFIPAGPTGAPDYAAVVHP